MPWQGYQRNMDDNDIILLNYTEIRNHLLKLYTFYKNPSLIQLFQILLPGIGKMIIGYNMGWIKYL